MNEQIKINWYRTKVDKQLMSTLMKRSDGRALTHCLLHLLLFATTATAAYLAFLQVNRENLIWSLPLLLACLFLHGTFSVYMGGTACHELCHKTPFRSQWLNDVFLYIFSFLSWFDPVGFRVSHVKHHQVTVHHGHDGEIILPLNLDWSPADHDEAVLPEKLNGKMAWFLTSNLLPFPNPVVMYQRCRTCLKYALGDLKGMGMYGGGEWWTGVILPDSKPDLRRKHRIWARVLLLGHLALAVVFIATGHWFLVILISCVGYAYWLGTLTGLPQHIGMMPDAPDFRLCCRTYTCSPFVGFLYWNMQYHVEHHMFPAVPFYNLPALRKAIEHDLPPAPHGLWATWSGIIAVLKKQRANPDYVFVPELPNAA